MPVPRLLRYATAAVLVRTADGGAVVGLVLLAVDPARRATAGPAVGGLLAAALTAPHLLGPWIAARLDRAADGRGLLAFCYLLYAAALAAGSVAVGHAPVVVPIGAVALAGCCGPLLTGGLSSRLAGIAGADERSQRRAQGLDALTYGIGGTAGPGAVAGLSALAGPLPALLALSVASALAAGLTLTLPARSGPVEAVTPGVRAGLAPLATSGPLRRVTTMTMFSAFGTGAMPLAAVALATGLVGRAGAGATLTVAIGIGSLVGSLAVTAFPLAGDPDRQAPRHFAAVAVVTAGCALAPTFVLALAGFALVGVATSTAFTTTLAARSAYAPPSARAQVFVTSAGLKVAMSSAGAALAGVGLGTGLDGETLLLVAAAIMATGVAIALIDRRFTATPVGETAAVPG